MWNKLLEKFGLSILEDNECLNVIWNVQSDIIPENDEPKIFKRNKKHFFSLLDSSKPYERASLLALSPKESSK